MTCMRCMKDVYVTVLTVQHYGFLTRRFLDPLALIRESSGCVAVGSIPRRWLLASASDSTRKLEIGNGIRFSDLADFIEQILLTQHAHNI